MKYLLFSMNRLLLFALSLTSLGAAAQQRAVYTEVNGASNGFSFSFDSRLAPRSHWGYDVGLGYSDKTYFTENRYSIAHVSLPLRMYYLTGRKYHFFESGIGVVPGFAQYTEQYVSKEETRMRYVRANIKQFRYYLTLNMGYRFQMPQGVILRTGFCINAHDRENADNVIQPYISLGYSF